MQGIADSFYLCGMQKTNVAIFASGTGSNAVNLIRHFADHSSIDVAFVLSNKEDADVLTSARELGITTFYRSNDDVADAEVLMVLCREMKIDGIVLAGYLRKIPEQFIQNFEGKIINLHPSLLPKFGGKGMYGSHVHKAVIESGEEESGITIHYVNEAFDEGRIIAQFHCSLDEGETVESLAGKIKWLEHSYFPTVIEQTLMQ